MSGFARPSLRLAIYQRDEFTCIYCQARFDPMEIRSGAFHPDLELDHVLARSLGGGNEPENLATCCLPCNDLKHGKTLEEFCARAGLDLSGVRRRLQLMRKRRLTRARDRSLRLLDLLAFERETRRSCPWCDEACVTCLIAVAKKHYMKVPDAHDEDRDDPGPEGLLGPEEGGDQTAGPAGGT